MKESEKLITLHRVDRVENIEWRTPQAENYGGKEVSYSLFFPPGPMGLVMEAMDIATHQGIKGPYKVQVLKFSL